MSEQEIFERQEQLFGQLGQYKLSQASAIICGLGGVGSQVAQQLTYLGIGRLLLIDPDIVEKSNINRLVGAGIKDVDRPKVKVINDMIGKINPEVQVSIMQTKLATDTLSLEQSKYDIIIGCVDNDSARLILTDFSSRLGLLYVDIATEIHMKDSVLGGHVFFSNGNGCLICTNQLDQNEIRHNNASESEKRFEEKTYGLSKSNLSGSGPAVVSLNSMIASYGVIEIMMQITGLTKSIHNIRIHRRAKFGNWTISHPQNERRTGCLYCQRYMPAVQNENYMLN